MIMSLVKFVFAFGVLTMSLTVGTVSAEDGNKIKAGMLPHVLECSADFNVTQDDVKTTQASGFLGTINPCFVECILKKAKLMDDQNLFDVNVAKEMTKKFLSDEANQKMGLDIISTCEAVNEREVDDDEKGCKRAKLLFECFMSFKDKVSFIKN